MSPPDPTDVRPVTETQPVSQAAPEKLEENVPNSEKQDEPEAHDDQAAEITEHGGSGPTPTSDAASKTQVESNGHVDSTHIEEKEAEDTGSYAEDEDGAIEGLSGKVANVSLQDQQPQPLTESTLTEMSPTPPPPPPKDDRFRGEVQSSKPLSLVTMDIANHETSVAHKTPEPVVEIEGADDRSEIQSIMEQFDEGMGGLGEDEIMSPRLEKAGPLLSSPASFPPRRSSLEPISSGDSLAKFHSSQSATSLTEAHPRRSSSLQPIPPPATSERPSSSDQLTPSKSQTSLHKPPPPVPDPEPDLPFDFHRFLEQLRHRTADPVAKFLRSFLLEFGKKQWMVHEQVKIISDFLEFIAKKMAQCDVWRTVSDAEFDNAREGMEKLVMNRLYNQCFSPAIPAPEPMPEGKGKRKGGQIIMGPGRRGQHQEDVERDAVLAQKVRIYGWVKEEHLDISPVGDKGRKFLKLAQQGMMLLTKPFETVSLTIN